jgi:hypothetical protein
VNITAPGVYDITASEYHWDPIEGGSLSSTGARRLTYPSCPARFRYLRDHPPAPSTTMTFGSAAHRIVLGAGDDIEVIDAPDWRTKAAREAREAAISRGRIPLLVADHTVAVAMAAVLAAHPVASKLLTPGTGRAEAALVWQTGSVWCRALIDWLPHPVPGRRMIVADYKTCAKADVESISQSMYTYGYHQQAAWYLAGVKALGLCPDPAFVFIYQEKTAPYLVTVAEPDATALRIGAHLNRLAVVRYFECTQTGIWPGYSEDIESLSLPGWVEKLYENEVW